MNNNSIILRALCFIALAAALISKASAQQEHTEIDLRIDTVCMSTQVFNETGLEYYVDTTFVTVMPPVGERPETVYAIDSDGNCDIDMWVLDPIECEEATIEERECLALPYGPESSVFKDQEGRDNTRRAPKVFATF